MREFWNVGVDLYMVEAIVDKGLASERKVQLPVRVDQKVVLSEADLALLEEEDAALAPEEPVARIMIAEGGEPVEETAPVADLTDDMSPGAGRTIYYIAAAALAALLLGTTLIIRRRASKA